MALVHYAVARLYGLPDVAVEACLVNAITGTAGSYSTVCTTVGGVGAFNYSVPRGGYFLRYRAVGETDASAVTDPNLTIVGLIGLLDGQSNMSRMWTGLGSPFTASGAVAVPAVGTMMLAARWSWSAWFNVTRRIATTVLGLGTFEPPVLQTANTVGGNALIEVHKQLYSMTGVPTGFVAVAVGGRGIEASIPGGATYNAMVSLVALPGGPGFDIDFACFDGGTTNAVNGSSFAEVVSYLQAYIVSRRNLSGNPTLPILIAPIGAMGPATDETVESVRQAILWILDNEANVFPLYYPNDVTIPDDFGHYGYDNQQRYLAPRMARNIAHALGYVAKGAAGPHITTCTIPTGGDTITVNVGHDGGTTLIDIFGNPAGSGLTGYDVMINDTVLPPDDARLDTGKVKALCSGFSASGSDAIYIRKDYGRRPDLTKPTLDDTAVAGSARGCPLQYSRGWVPVTVTP